MARCWECRKPFEVDEDDLYDDYCGTCISKWPVADCGHSEHPDKIVGAPGKTLCADCDSEWSWTDEYYDDDPERDYPYIPDYANDDPYRSLHAEAELTARKPQI
jgi:hypothetical protein